MCTLRAEIEDIHMRTRADFGFVTEIYQAAYMCIGKHFLPCREARYYCGRRKLRLDPQVFYKDVIPSGQSLVFWYEIQV